MQFRNMTNAKTLFPTNDPDDLLKLKKLKSKLLTKAVLKALQLDKIDEIYRKTGEMQGAAFLDSVLEQLKIHYTFREEELKNIPKTGSFMVIANHPYGGIDGLILMSLLLKQRPDFKMMLNYLLQQFPEVLSNSILVDPFERKSSTGMNMKGIRKSLSLLKNDTPVGIFPAGEVSTFQIDKMRITDKQWHPVVGKMILKAEVPVVPVYFSGHNSFLFHMMGLVNPKLRTARLPAELFNKKESIQVRIGKPVYVSTIKSFQDSDKLLRFLRAKTYSLGSSLDVKSYFMMPPVRKKIAEPIIPETPVEQLLLEIEQLNNEKSLLVKQMHYSVYIAGSVEIPAILREISRLREITFREVGEGTNHAFDSDEFDLYYKHLFVWDHENNKLVGAYRIGEGIKLYARYGKKGFYLNQLFKFTKDFDAVFKSSLELGRSFIVNEYQRSPFALMLLWKGIYEFVNRNPGYSTLIGPVSISNAYTHLSKGLMVNYILKNHFDKELAAMVSPRKQYRFTFKGESKGFKDSDIQEMRLIDQLISDIEPTRSKVPVLLKKYLSKHAKIIAFNVDPEFNHSLDGLLILKLKDIPDGAFNLT